MQLCWGAFTTCRATIMLACTKLMAAPRKKIQRALRGDDTKPQMMFCSMPHPSFIEIIDSAKKMACIVL